MTADHLLLVELNGPEGRFSTQCRLDRYTAWVLYNEFTFDTQDNERTTLTMIPLTDLTDLMRAIDDLTTLYRKIFLDFTPLYDEDDAMMVRALAALNKLARKENQT